MSEGESVEFRCCDFDEDTVRVSVSGGSVRIECVNRYTDGIGRTTAAINRLLASGGGVYVVASRQEQMDLTERWKGRNVEFVTIHRCSDTTRGVRRTVMVDHFVGELSLRDDSVWYELVRLRETAHHWMAPP